MKKLTLILASLLCVLCALAQSRSDEQPIITFKSNIYSYSGATNSFHFSIGASEETYIDVDCGAGLNEVLVTPALFDEESQEVSGTSVTCNVGPDGIVKIYGDASLIDYFYAEGCYLESIDFGDCVNLDILNLQHNELKSLDLSKYTKLSAIYLSDNPFTAETPLVIGENHPGLIILEVDIIDHMTPDFDITHYPSLVVFDAYANKSLTRLDPSQCPGLRRLSLDSCPISSIDVSSNPDLQVLNVSDTRITTLDISTNEALTQLYMSHDSGVLNTDCKFTSIDISNNPLLTFLSASGNNLTSIDLSNNPLLFDLYLQRNHLTSLDVSDNPDIYNFDISQNDMSFATLPLPSPTYFEYYCEQRPLAMATSYAEGASVDLSAKILREDSSTDAVLYSYNFATNTSQILDESYYDYADGIITFKKASTDSLYVSFANSLFPGVNQETTRFMVKTSSDFGKPTMQAKLLPAIGDGTEMNIRVGLSGATPESPRTFFVDPGDGSMLEFTASTSTIPEQANVVAARKQSSYVILYIPEGESLTALGADNMPLNGIDVSAATGLRYLSLNNTGLYNIDLGYNYRLRSLDLGNCNLYSLTLAGINGLAEKNMLSDINLSHNNLTDVTLNETRAIHNLDLSHNNFTAFNYKDFDNIVTFNISHNKIDIIDLSYMTAAGKVDVSDNMLTFVTLPAEGGIRELNLSGNLFTLQDIPEKPTATETYHYAPQAEITMPTKAPGANLSAQNRIIDGVGTTFTWKTVEGTVLTDGVDVKVDNGNTRFLAPIVGKQVYCEMSNPAFPEFSGDNVLRTTAMEASEMPTNLLASFTTSESQTAELSFAAEKDGTALYIDWSGEGYDLEQYVLGTTYRLFTANTIAGATAKVYTYTPEDRISVFSISKVSMTDMDASGLADAYTISVNDAGLPDIKLPEGKNLHELNLGGNALTDEFDFSRFSNLVSLSIDHNRLTKLDLSRQPSLQLVGASFNEIDKVTFGNNSRLWLFYASDNQISEIDFTGAENITQLALGNNELTSIDVSMLNPVELQLSGNNLSFATLPLPKDSYVIYNYTNQAPLDVKADGGVVDLSSQAVVNGVATEFHWFLGNPSLDDNGALTGEELVADEEYTIKDGVTTFHSDFDGVICVMTNPTFPNLYMLTTPLDVTSGVFGVAAADSGEPVYYDLQGIRIGRPVPGSIYIVRRGTATTKELFR